MKSLIYLMLLTTKNRILELKRHPAKLIFILFFVVMFGMVVISSILDGPKEADSYRSMNEFYAIILALYTFVFGLSANQGLKSGSSFFSIADVQLLFPAPISSRKVLIYGLIKQMSTSLLVGFFLLYQYNWVNQSYGVTISGLLLVLLGYAVCMFASQLTAMTIYVFTSHNERKQRAVKIGIYTIAGLLILYLLFPIFKDQSDLMGTITQSANSLVVSLLPVAGWLKAGVVGSLSGDFLMVLAGFGATALLIVGLVTAISKAHGDFYEDVLQATEVTHSVITAKKEGNIDSIPSKNIKVGKQGLEKGAGASAFFHKHLIENRRSRIFLLDKSSLILIAAICVFAYFLRENGIVPVLFFSTYVQIFNVSTGRWVMELNRPFVYLVPEPAFKKLMYLCFEGIYKIIVEAIVLFVIIGFIVNVSPGVLIACILMRIGFGMLMITGNILIKRILGSVGSSAIQVMVYFLLMLVLCVPSVIVAFILTVTLSSSLVIPLLATFVLNLFISALVLLFCRNILNYAELNNR